MSNDRLKRDAIKQYEISKENAKQKLEPIGITGYDPLLTFQTSKTNKKADVLWIKLDNSGHSCEGLLHIPRQKESEDLVIFQPGLPGGGIKIFEDQHAFEFIDQGYSVLVLRNNGMNSTSNMGSGYVNCPERSRLGLLLDSKLGSEVIGCSRNWSHHKSIQSIFNAVNSLHDSFVRMHLIAHSYGGLVVALSLNTFNSRDLPKINSVVFEAPLVARPREVDGQIRWGEELAANGQSTTFTTLLEVHKWMIDEGIYTKPPLLTPVGLVEELVSMSNTIHDNPTKFNSTVKRALFLNPSNDEYIEASGVDGYLKVIPKEVDVRTMVYLEDEKTRPDGLEAHDMPTTSVEEFDEFFEGNRPHLFRRFGR